MKKHGSSSALPFLPSFHSGGRRIALCFEQMTRAGPNHCHMVIHAGIARSVLLWSRGGRSIYYLWLEKCWGGDQHTWPSHGLRILRNCNNGLQRWLKGDLFLKPFKEEARGARVKQCCLAQQCICLQDSACCSYSSTQHTHTSQRGSWASSC